MYPQEEPNEAMMRNALATLQEYYPEFTNFGIAKKQLPSLTGLDEVLYLNYRRLYFKYGNFRITGRMRSHVFINDVEPRARVLSQCNLFYNSQTFEIQKELSSVRAGRIMAYMLASRAGFDLRPMNGVMENLLWEVMQEVQGVNSEVKRLMDMYHSVLVQPKKRKCVGCKNAQPAT